MLLPVTETFRPAAIPVPITPDLVVRDPASALQALRSAWQGHRERWIFEIGRAHV